MTNPETAPRQGRAGRSLIFAMAMALLLGVISQSLSAADPLSIDVNGDVSAANDLSVTGNTSVTGTLSVTGATTLSDDLEVTGDIGIGLSNPVGALHIAQDDGTTYPTPAATANDLVIENTTSAGITLFTPNDKSGWIFFADEDANAEGEIEYDHSGKFMMFKVEGSAKLQLNNTGYNQAYGLWNFNSELQVWDSFIAQDTGHFVGYLTKAGGGFKIDHPLDPENKDLLHGFVEAPRNDLIYRGTVELVDGQARVDLDQASGMTSGTFVEITQNIQYFLQNHSGWDPVKGAVRDGVLHITCKDDSSTDTIYWMVTAERGDPWIRHTDFTDEDGHLIVEPLKEEATEEEVAAATAPRPANGRSETSEPARELRGKRGWVQHPEVYPDAKALPTRDLIPDEAR